VARDRTSNSPRIQCSSGTTGNWSSSVTDNCTACRSCTSTSSATALSNAISNTNEGSMAANSTIISFQSSGQQNCGKRTRSCSMTNCISSCANNDHFSKSHLGKVKIEYHESKKCKKSCGGAEKCTRHTNINAHMTIQCIDGQWQGTEYMDGSEIQCNGI